MKSGRVEVHGSTVCGLPVERRIKDESSKSGQRLTAFFLRAARSIRTLAEGMTHPPCIPNFDISVTPAV